MEPTSPMESEWPRLLDAARAGDEVALGAMCTGVYEYLLLVARSGLGKDLRNKLDASDVVQQSLLEAHRDFERFSGDSESAFRLWAVRLLKRNLIDASRQYRAAARRDVAREAVLGDDSDQQLPSRDPNASRIARRKESQQDLARAVSELPERQRVVIEARHRDYQSYAEISALLGVSEPAARKLYARAIQALRQRLVPLDDSSAGASPSWF